MTHSSAAQVPKDGSRTKGWFHACFTRSQEKKIQIAIALAKAFARAVYDCLA